MAAIVINRPVDTVFHYLVPQELRDLIQPGQRVRVPFGKGDQPTVGYCVDVTSTAPTSKRLKTILEILDREPLLSQPMLELTRWIGERYLCSWGQVLESVVPAGVKKQAGTREIVCYEAAPELQNGPRRAESSGEAEADPRCPASCGRAAGGRRVVAAGRLRDGADPDPAGEAAHHSGEAAAPRRPPSTSGR